MILHDSIAIMLAVGVRMPLRLRSSSPLVHALGYQSLAPRSRQSLVSRSFHRPACLRQHHAPSEVPSFLEAYKQAGMSLIFPPLRRKKAMLGLY